MPTVPAEAVAVALALMPVTAPAAAAAPDDRLLLDSIVHDASDTLGTRSDGVLSTSQDEDRYLAWREGDRIAVKVIRDHGLAEDPTSDRWIPTAPAPRPRSPRHRCMGLTRFAGRAEAAEASCANAPRTAWAGPRPGHGASGHGPTLDDVESRERFVPRRVGQLTTELADLPWEEASGGEAFRSSARMVAALYHFEFHDREQAMIDAWEATGTDPGALGRLTDGLKALLHNANYVEVTMAELHDAMAQESLIPLRLEVDLEDYEELLVFRRGGRREMVDISRWRGLRTEQRTITVEERVVVLTHVKPSTWFAERGISPADRDLIPGQVSLKEFRDVPRADVEMLLPSTQIRFRPIDAVLVGLPALVSGIVVLATKLLPTIGLIIVLLGAWLGVRDDTPELDQSSLVALLGGIIALGGFLLRQWSKLKNRRLRYMKTLSETLYFRTLADGPGVVHALLSSAEQQEVIEVLLAHRFLLAAPDGLSAGDLDAAVERWVRDTCQQEVDFEVDDALRKLRGLDLVEDGPLLRSRPLHEALTLLDQRWDDLFRHPLTGSTLTVTKA